TYHDTIGTHTQRITDQVTDGHRPSAIRISDFGFHAQNVLLLQLQLGCIFDRDDTLLLRDEAGTYVEQRSLPGARTPGDYNIQMGKHTGPDELCHLRGQGAIIDQLLNGQLILFELPDGDRRAIDSNRANDGIDARAIGQAGVNRRAVRIYATAK